MPYAIDYFCLSHTGRLRRVNQDNFFCLDRHMPQENSGTGGVLYGRVSSGDSPVFGVFDGMGGEECGEAASFLAAEKLAGFPLRNRPERALVRYCREANADICRYTEEHSLTSMGTTAAILLFARRKIHLCSIGDSKVFRLPASETEGGLEQISRDHVIASVYGTKPLLTQNLGIPETELILEPHIAHGSCRDGDIYLICSDGLTDMVETREIQDTLRTCGKEKAAEELLRKALAGGGRDNITILLLYITEEQSSIFHSIRNRLHRTEVSSSWQRQA